MCNIGKVDFAHYAVFVSLQFLKSIVFGKSITMNSMANDEKKVCDCKVPFKGR